MSLPERPRLRPVDAQRITRNGKDCLAVSDPRHLADGALLVPEQLAPYLALADGSRTLAEIAGAGMFRGAPPVPAKILEQLFQRLDQLFLIENGAYQQERARRLEAYLSATHRPPALAGGVYASQPDALIKQLAGYSDGSMVKGPRPAGRLSAILSRTLTTPVVARPTRLFGGRRRLNSRTLNSPSSLAQTTTETALA